MHGKHSLAQLVKFFGGMFRLIFHSGNGKPVFCSISTRKPAAGVKVGEHGKHPLLQLLLQVIFHSMNGKPVLGSICARKIAYGVSSTLRRRSEASGHQLVYTNYESTLITSFTLIARTGVVFG